MAMESWFCLAASLIVTAPLTLSAGTLTSTAVAQERLPPPAVQGGTRPAMSRRDHPAITETPGTKAVTGTSLLINGKTQVARWQWRGSSRANPEELWLPLEVLEGQLGVSSRTKSDGSLDLEWFGTGLLVPPASQRTLGDEVAVNVVFLLETNGVVVSRDGNSLNLQLRPPRLLKIRSGKQPGGPRVVLDLDGPAVVRTDGDGLDLDLASGREQRARLQALGLRGRQGSMGLSLVDVRPTKVFTLGDPARIVIDLPAAAGTRATAQSDKPTPIDPRLRALLGPELRWEQQVRQVGGERVLVNFVNLDPRSSPLELQTLSKPSGMQGLSSLVQLARSKDALVAINGGYFNRVRRLPLGALKDQGRWLSGPILSRGVVAWESRGIPQFGRLRLNEWITGSSGRRWPLLFLNSGYVQKGLSRYTSDWGPHYQPLSGQETALLLRNGVAQRRFNANEVDRGIPLRGGDTLVVARGGAVLPWKEGEHLTIQRRSNGLLEDFPNVLGGGPLLLRDGQIVLNGMVEGFSPSFLRQGAPRTVIGSDGSKVWLITMEGVKNPGPTLAQAAIVLRSMGLRDALNLDGGSSTGLVMGGSHRVKGRGVAGSVHNGLGLVLRTETGT